MKKIITSESVNKGHPDKTCDIIADAILDELLKQDKSTQCALECAIKNDKLFIYGEVTTKAQVNYSEVAKNVLKEIGYINDFKIISEISNQSPDINQAVVKEELMANDQGIIFGYACNDTVEFMPLPIMISHKLMMKYEEFRIQNDSLYFPDAKSQVSVVYDGNKPVAIDTVLISVSHSESLVFDEIEKTIKEKVINPVLEEYNKFIDDKIKYIINPSGKFTIWGSFGDSGCVGRKIVVDSYGGVGKVGGGCFSSKNATKVDRSGAYYCRYVAKNLVANGLCDICEIQVSYGIGLPNPISMYIETYGTNKVTMETLYEVVENNFNFRLSNIISELDLLNPVYKNTACYGHFGRNEFTWEKVKKL